MKPSQRSVLLTCQARSVLLRCRRGCSLALVQWRSTRRGYAIRTSAAGGSAAFKSFLDEKNKTFLPPPASSEREHFFGGHRSQANLSAAFEEVQHQSPPLLRNDEGHQRCLLPSSSSQSVGQSGGDGNGEQRQPQPRRRRASRGGGGGSDKSIRQTPGRRRREDEGDDRFPQLCFAARELVETVERAACDVVCPGATAGGMSGRSSATRDEKKQHQQQQHQSLAPVVPQLDARVSRIIQSVHHLLLGWAATSKSYHLSPPMAMMDSSGSSTRAKGRKDKQKGTELQLLLRREPYSLFRPLLQIDRAFQDLQRLPSLTRLHHSSRRCAQTCHTADEKKRENAEPGHEQRSSPQAKQMCHILYTAGWEARVSTWQQHSGVYSTMWKLIQRTVEFEAKQIPHHDHQCGLDADAAMMVHVAHCQSVYHTLWKASQCFRRNETLLLGKKSKARSSSYFRLLRESSAGGGYPIDASMLLPVIHPSTLTRRGSSSSVSERGGVDLGIFSHCVGEAEALRLVAQRGALLREIKRVSEEFGSGGQQQQQQQQPGSASIRRRKALQHLKQSVAEVTRQIHEMLWVPHIEDWCLRYWMRSVGGSPGWRMGDGIFTQTFGPTRWNTAAATHNSCSTNRSSLTLEQATSVLSAVTEYYSDKKKSSFSVQRGIMEKATAVDPLCGASFSYVYVNSLSFWFQQWEKEGRARRSAAPGVFPSSSGGEANDTTDSYTQREVEESSLFWIRAITVACKALEAFPLTLRIQHHHHYQGEEEEESSNTTPRATALETLKPCSDIMEKLLSLLVSALPLLASNVNDLEGPTVSHLLLTLTTLGFSGNIRAAKDNNAAAEHNQQHGVLNVYLLLVHRASQLADALSPSEMQRILQAVERLQPSASASENGAQTQTQGQGQGEGGGGGGGSPETSWDETLRMAFESASRMRQLWRKRGNRSPP